MRNVFFWAAYVIFVFAAILMMSTAIAAEIVCPENIVEAATISDVDPILEQDKPEYHIEATEPPKPELFDSNSLDWDYDYVFRVVGAECRGEPVEGIMAVCQCILDTALHDGITPEEVVKRPGQYAAPMASSVFDGGEMVNECMLRVFACGERAVDDDIEFFCTVSCNSAWHNSLQYCFTIGGHNFYARWE